MGIWGEFFGHKFEPVFETEATSNVDPAVVQSMVPAIQESYGAIDGSVEDNPYAEILREMKGSKKIYIHHICPRCGTTVKRE
jgi:hypothetical protein